MPKSTGLRYLGTDPVNEWLPGVPARDIEAGEITELGLDFKALASSTLYTPADVVPAQTEEVK